MASQDLFKELIETVKNHPVKSMIAYDLATSEKRKKEINEKMMTYALAFLLLGFLRAPKFYDHVGRYMYENKMLTQLDGTEASEKKLKGELDGLRSLLWLIAIFGWGCVLLAVVISAWQNANHGGYNPGYNTDTGQ